MTYEEFETIHREEGTPEHFIRGLWESKPDRNGTYEDLNPEHIRAAAKDMALSFQLFDIQVKKSEEE